MKIELLTVCMLGKCGEVIDMPDENRARQLIAKKVAKEVEAEEKKTKGGKKPTETIETK